MSYSFPPPFCFNGMNLLSLEQVLSLKTKTHFRMALSSQDRTKQEVTKLFFFVKMTRNHGNTP